MPRSRTSDSFKARKEIAPVSDTDLFFNTFEKPTQIYRYLKTRFISSPLFLHRTLSYMRGRSKRNNKTRIGFKVNDILSRIQQQHNKDHRPTENENLIIGFVSFHDSHLQTRYVKVDTKLEKVSYKRRKESTMAQNQIRIGESSVIVNTDQNGTDKLPAVCVSATEFDRLGDNVQTTYQLTFDIESQPSPFTGQSSEEPSSKYPCYSKTYHAELPVFDKQGRNLLVNGLYQVTALERHAFRPSHMLCWENFPSEADQHIADWAEEVNRYYFAEEDSNPFVTFDKTPKIQLYMEWTRSKITGNNYIPRPKFITDQHNNNKENSLNGSIVVANGSISNGVEKKVHTIGYKAFIFQFIVNNSTKQRTEDRSDYVCPWCSLNCIQVYSLMKHLKLCHARLLFQYVEDENKARIDVYINELYDGSYSGAPHDILLGTQRQSGPTRRNVVTNIMVFRPRKPTFKMCEFQEVDDGELEQQRQYISGHNRIYYHSETCIPIMPKELDYDSEGEPDPKWLQRTTKQMIDEFTDVNEGEKELMKLWNLHIMKHGFVGDCQIPLACDLFIKERGFDLLEKNLYRNYIVHLDSMFNYGLVSPQVISGNINKLNEMILANLEQVQKLKTGRKTQLGNWYSRKSVTEKSSIKIEKKQPEEIQSISKISTKEDRTRSSGKIESREVTKAKVVTRHSDVNGHAKLKNNFKRKMST